MSDLIKEVNYLRFYFTSDDACKEKDWCKNDAYAQYCNKMRALFGIPLVLQIWQISATNVAEKAALYKNVRMFKSVAMLGACSLGMWEMVNLRKKMTFYDRFYPEMTELQKKLNLEALMFKESAYKEESVEERMQKLEDPEKVLKYSQFYMLAPQNHIIAEEEFEGPEHEQH